jgi:uncharacterized membrane protein
MTEGRDVPGDDVSSTSADNHADEPLTSSEPPTIGWETGVAWVPADPASAEVVAPPGPPIKLGVGSVLGRSIDQFVRRPLLFLGLAIPVSLMSAVGLAVPNDPGVIGLTLLMLLVELAIGVVCSIAMIIAADHLRAGHEVSLGGVIREALGRSVAGILSAIAQGVAFIGLCLVAAIPVVVLSAGGTGGALIGLILFIVAFALLAMVYVRWMLSQAAVALDGQGPIQALRRSRSVTRGNAWRLSGLVTLLGVLTLPLSIGLGVLSFSGEDLPLVMVLAAVSSFLAGPLYAIALATAYGDLTSRPAVELPAQRTTLGRGILIGTILACGAVALVIGVPKVGPAFNRLVLAQIPADDRGIIRAGSVRNQLDPCKPSSVKTSFAASDSVYIGGYFRKVIPRGESAMVYFYMDGVLSASQPLTSATQLIGCYYEQDPLVGAPAASYRLVINYLGETIAEGAFVIR